MEKEKGSNLQTDLLGYFDLTKTSEDLGVEPELYSNGKNEDERGGEDCIRGPAHRRVFVHAIVAVLIVVTHQLGVDADTGVVSCAEEVFWVGAGPAPIPRVTAGVRAVVWIPVVGAIFSHESFEVLAVVCVIVFQISIANGLIVCG